MEGLFEWLAPALAPVRDVVVTLLVGVLVALAVKGLRRLGLDVEVKQEQQLGALARQAVLYVEEIAAQQLKKQMRTWSPDEKLARAMQVVQDKLPKADAGDVRRAVHAALPDVNAGATVVVNAVVTPAARPPYGI